MEWDLLSAGARLALDQWERRLGAPAAPEPGLVAVMDQHGARIRAAVGAVNVVNLAAYADGVADVAARRGWEASAVGDWRRAPWISVHLLAVCLMGRAAS
ncbi:DUF6401 family natural product biosynthesis protein [Actinoplanes sp. HUAS TT8]|uniref:DUF6401 family natural product biosynthesis protein n=1 Tax=Actinoplanes sp. HUAS TT8 TaxID=3447453 RepID=UPI003F524C77